MTPLRSLIRVATVIAGSFLLFLSTCACAQPKDGHRLGVLISGSEVTHSRFVRQLQAGLNDLGYFPGKNISLVMRYANGETAKLPDLARELVAERDDLIVT